jgi:hypothetical protein
MATRFAVLLGDAEADRKVGERLQVASHDLAVCGDWLEFDIVAASMGVGLVVADRLDQAGVQSGLNRRSREHAAFTLVLLTGSHPENLRLLGRVLVDEVIFVRAGSAGGRDRPVRLCGFLRYGNQRSEGSRPPRSTAQAGPAPCARTGAEPLSCRARGSGRACAYDRRTGQTQGLYARPPLPARVQERHPPGPRHRLLHCTAGAATHLQPADFAGAGRMAAGVQWPRRPLPARGPLSRRSSERSASRRPARLVRTTREDAGRNARS